MNYARYYKSPVLSSPSPKMQTPLGILQLEGQLRAIQFRSLQAHAPSQCDQFVFRSTLTLSPGMGVSPDAASAAARLRCGHLVTDE